MVDVLKIAMERREKLESDVRELDGFIRMAERLIRTSRDFGAASGADSFQFSSGEGRAAASSVSTAG